jgi:hypothetical protein
LPYFRNLLYKIKQASVLKSGKIFAPGKVGAGRFVVHTSKAYFGLGGGLFYTMKLSTTVRRHAAVLKVTWV